MAKLWLAVAFVVFGASFAQADYPDWRNEIDLKRASLAPFSMTLLKNGKTAGSMTYGWQLDRGNYIIRNHTKIGDAVTEVAEGRLDAFSLLPKSVSVDFIVGSDRIDADLVWQDGWRTGTVMSVRNGRHSSHDINMMEDTPAPLRMAMYGLVPALPLRSGYSCPLPWFNTLANRVEVVTPTVTGKDRTTTLAGTFDTWRVEIKGGVPEITLYITQSLPHQLIRIDVAGVLQFDRTH